MKEKKSSKKSKKKASGQKKPQRITPKGKKPTFKAPPAEEMPTGEGKLPQVIAEAAQLVKEKLPEVITEEAQLAPEILPEIQSEQLKGAAQLQKDLSQDMLPGSEELPIAPPIRVQAREVSTMTSYSFPSIIESHNNELKDVAPDLLHGLKIYENDMGYIMGDLALSEGIAPNKAINSSPHDLDYRLLARAGLLLASGDISKPLILTTGFPFSTYQANRTEAESFFRGTHQIKYDSSPYGGDGIQSKNVVVADVEIIPEILGCTLAARYGEERWQGNFFIASLGYGTFESCLSTEKGIVQRTLTDANGLRYAIDLAMKEILKSYYLGMRTEYQFDIGFQEGLMVINRQRVDITEVRKRSLERYYQDIISPALRNAWKDDDFRRTPLLLLAGGGALYPELVACFTREFQGVLDVHVVAEPMTLASRGYCLRALHLAGGNKEVAVGLDIGNSHTVVTTFAKAERYKV